MPTVRLIAALDGYSDNVGLILKGMPNTGNYPVVAMEGRIIAHDILEHIVVPATTVSYTGEQMAIGSSWYVRGSYGGYSKRTWRDPAIAIAQEIASLTCDLLRLESRRGFVWPQDIDKVRIVGLYADDVLRIRDQVTGFLRAELLNTEESFTTAEVELAVVRAMKRFMVGIRAAIRRYKDQAGVNQLFWDISDAVDPYTKSPQEGQEIELTYNLTRGRVRIRQIEEDQWGYDS